MGPYEFSPHVKKYKEMLQWNTWYITGQGCGNKSLTEDRKRGC